MLFKVYVALDIASVVNYGVLALVNFIDGNENDTPFLEILKTMIKTKVKYLYYLDQTSNKKWDAVIGWHVKTYQLSNFGIHHDL